MYHPIKSPTIRKYLQISTSCARSRRNSFLIALGAALFALSPAVLAVSPAPDGGYPNENTAEGDDALFSLTTGGDNTALGFNALKKNTSGSSNTATGASALFNNTTGPDNTANGDSALFNNTTGSSNTAVGAVALQVNTRGFANTAVGAAAMLNSTTGSNNTAVGAGALQRNSTGGNNTTSGVQSLEHNTTGGANTAAGVSSLASNTTGTQNTASGFAALFFNTTGSFNTAEGLNALYRNSTGSNNIAQGLAAGADLTTGSYNIDIGNRGIAGETGRIRIGTKTKQTNTYIAGINGVAIPGGVGVIVDTNGHLGTVVSSARFKEQIRPMNEESRSILSLQPVTFHYKQEIDPQHIEQFGLVAEDVEKVNPDLVARDESGKPYTVRYEAINAMLLNEFLRAHRHIEEQDQRLNTQETSIAEQKSEIEALKANLKQQAELIQKVSDRGKWKPGGE